MKRVRGEKPNFKNKKVLFSWLRSFILILLIPIVLMMAVYWKTTDVIEEEVNRAHAALLTQLQQDIDGQIESVQRMSQEISLNARVRNLLFITEDLDAEKRMLIYQTLNDFSIFRLTNQAIGPFYIYFKDPDFVLTEHSYHKREDFYKRGEFSSWLTYESWQGLIQGTHRSQVMNINLNGRSDSQDKDSIVFLQSLPVEDIHNAKATLVIHLNHDRLYQNLMNIQAYQDGHVYIIDGDHQVLLSTDESASQLDDSLWEGMEERYGVVHRQESGEKMTISYIQSEFMNWKYVYKLPTGKFQEKAQYIRDLTWLIMVVAMLVGTALAIVLARRHYHPLKGLVQSLSSRINIEQGLGADEYRFLEKAIDSTFEEKNILSQKIEQQHLMLRSNFLARLVKGRIDQQEPLEEMYESHQIMFKSDHFAILMFYIEDYNGLFLEEENDTGKKLKLVHLIVQNIVEEMSGQKHVGYVAEADEMLFCLFNFDSTYDNEEYFQDLVKVAQNAHQFIQNRFRIDLTISVSNIHRTAQGLPDAYQEALQAMEYKILNANPSVILYENIRLYDGTYTYTLEKEQQLINYIKAGAVVEAERTVDEIISGNVAGGHMISVEMAQCLMFDMTSTMMKASMEVSSDQPDLFTENQNSIQALLQCQSIPEMRIELSKFLERVCAYLDSKKKSHNMELLDTVKKYIEERYADPNLSLTVLAEFSSVSSSYLSRYFKEQVGRTLSDYISKHRIEKAKELLVEGNVQQKYIAEQVGFNSISTFIRTFKKMEGVTPGMYRDGNR